MRVRLNVGDREGRPVLNVREIVADGDLDRRADTTVREIVADGEEEEARQLGKEAAAITHSKTIASIDVP